MILYHVSSIGKLRRLSPKKPRHYSLQALYLAPTLQDAAYWQKRLDEEKKKAHVYVYEVEVNSLHELYTNGQQMGTEVRWELGQPTWMGQVWSYRWLPVKHVYRKKVV